uniref:Uncharacterized protein n=1 Tax=Trichuris muris TaxID=70415 RepID=A0A5S6QDM3_TRIMR
MSKQGRRLRYLLSLVLPCRLLASDTDVRRGFLKVAECETNARTKNGGTAKFERSSTDDVLPARRSDDGVRPPRSSQLSAHGKNDGFQFQRFWAAESLTLTCPAPLDVNPPCRAAAVQAFLLVNGNTQREPPTEKLKNKEEQGAGANFYFSAQLPFCGSGDRLHAPRDPLVADATTRRDCGVNPPKGVPPVTSRPPHRLLVEQACPDFGLPARIVPPCHRQRLCEQCATFERRWSDPPAFPQCAAQATARSRRIRSSPNRSTLDGQCAAAKRQR